MLGVGTPELIVIGLVILIFYGPDRLPSLLSKVNRFFRDIKNAGHDVSQQVNREIAKFESEVVRLEEDPNKEESTSETEKDSEKEQHHHES